VFGPGPNGVYGRCQGTAEAGQVYLAMYRLSWSFGLFILALICLAGWGGWVTSILSMQSWTTYSRLVYGAYLIHPILCQAFTYGAQRALLYSDWNLLNWYSGLAALSFAFSAISYVLLEGPLLRIVKGYIPR
jgi:peptidoglycan/LPS O-acetylase OafA/YrhL